MTPPRSASPFEPFRHRAFRHLWLASLCQNLGLWMQVVTAGWLMVSLQGTPLQVGLVQTASAMPAFLFALPAGVLADLIERRRILLTTQGGVGLVALLTAGLVASGLIGPVWLLLLTFAFGIGFAVQGPSWFTSQLDVLPAESRLAAVSLGAVSYSSARAIGPALAGGLMLWLPPSAVFASIGGLALLSLWLVHSVPQIPRHPAPGHAVEGFRVAFANTLRYARDSRPLQSQLLRTTAFVLPASALWALLPLLARVDGAQAGRYGLLLGCLGVGAVIGALLLPLAHSSLSVRRIDGIGILTFLLASITAPLLHEASTLVPLFVVAGIGWSWVGNLGLTTLQLLASPPLRARALALYIIIFQGSMAVGGALWGRIAESTGVDAALGLAAGCLLISIAISRVLPWPKAHDAGETPLPASAG